MSALHPAYVMSPSLEVELELIPATPARAAVTVSRPMGFALISVWTIAAALVAQLAFDGVPKLTARALPSAPRSLSASLP